MEQIMDKGNLDQKSEFQFFKKIFPEVNSVLEQQNSSHTLSLQPAVSLFIFFSLSNLVIRSLSNLQYYN